MYMGRKPKAKPWRYLLAKFWDEPVMTSSKMRAEIERFRSVSVETRNAQLEFTAACLMRDSKPSAMETSYRQVNSYETDAAAKESWT